MSSPRRSVRNSGSKPVPVSSLLPKKITLKTLVDSDKKEFINSLKHISERAKKAGLTESDISAAVQQVRSKGS